VAGFGFRFEVKPETLKEPPPLPCGTRSFEHVLLHVELARQLSTSTEGMSATAGTHSVIVLITVQGLFPITNNAGKIVLQRSDGHLENRLVRGFSQVKSSKKFSRRGQLKLAFTRRMVGN
jgi:hypothetical protein